MTSQAQAARLLREGNRVPREARDGSRVSREERRQLLLQAAGAVFTSQGYHAASMDDIAEAAGVSKPVLYQHFSSKLELYLARVDQACDRLISVVREALASTTINRDRVSATMTAFYDHVAHQQADFRLLFESDVVGMPQVRDRVEAVVATLAEDVAAVIGEDTALSPAQARLLATSLVGVAQTSARAWARDPDAISLSDAAELTTRLAWRGIRGFPAQ